MMDKLEILTDMRIHPAKYSREDVYEYINSGTLTREELVTNSRILTDSAFNHIKRFPHLCMEQHVLPVSLLERPISKTGNTDVYFFGIPGSGRSCLLAGLMSLVGQIGFQFNPLGPGGGGKYAEDLRNYAHNNMLPPATDQNFIQVIDAKINDEKNNSKKIAFIELPGENLIKCVKKNLLACIDDMGPGASCLLNNGNHKIIFFVIDLTNEVSLSKGVPRQADVVRCVMSILSNNRDIMERVDSINIILTKSDTICDHVDFNVFKEKLDEQEFMPVIGLINRVCQQYYINGNKGFQVGIYPFNIGKFMPGEVYSFDETDSLKLLRVIQQNIKSTPKEKGFKKLLSSISLDDESIIRWFNC